MQHLQKDEEEWETKICKLTGYQAKQISSSSISSTNLSTNNSKIDSQIKTSSQNILSTFSHPVFKHFQSTNE
jgi:hypothetical protein